jgi:hypothetical protein
MRQESLTWRRGDGEKKVKKGSPPGSIADPETLQPAAAAKAAGKQAASQRGVEAKRKNGPKRHTSHPRLFASTSLCETSLPDDTTARFSDFQADGVVNEKQQKNFSTMGPVLPLPHG